MMCVEIKACRGSQGSMTKIPERGDVKCVKIEDKIPTIKAREHPMARLARDKGTKKKAGIHDWM